MYRLPISHPTVLVPAPAPPTQLSGLFCDDCPGCSGALMWMPVFYAAVGGAALLTVAGGVTGGPLGALGGLGLGAAGLVGLAVLSCGPWGSMRPDFCPQWGCE